MNNQRPPLPPFTHETAVQKVRLAEDGWNSRDPVKVSLAYTEDSAWRKRLITAERESLQGQQKLDQRERGPDRN